MLVLGAAPVLPLFAGEAAGFATAEAAGEAEGDAAVVVAVVGLAVDAELQAPSSKPAVTAAPISMRLLLPMVATQRGVLVIIEGPPQHPGRADGAIGLTTLVQADVC